MTETIGKLALALAKAQGQIKNAAKDNENPAFKRGAIASKYADLASVWDACREALTANEIAVIQQVDGGPETVTVSTVLAHSSGETISCSVTGKPTKPDVQGIGSTITYLRRYSLAAMVGVAPEDDDGNAASEGSGKAPVTKAESTASKAAAQQAPKGIALNLAGGEATYHGTVTAYLDAYAKAAKETDDPNALFEANMEKLQELQAKAAQAKTPQGDQIVGRIKAVFDDIAAGDPPKMVAE